MNRKIISEKNLFLLCCMLFMFVYGVTTHKYKIFPYSIISYMTEAVETVFEQKDMMLGTRPTEYLMPARYDGSGVTRFTKDSAPGLTLLAGFFDDSNELRLIRGDGEIVNRWPVKFFDFFPDPSHLSDDQVPKTNWNAPVHGAMALPDGSE